MDLDVSIGAHDLPWRLRSQQLKSVILKATSARKSQIVETEMAKLVESGLVLEKDNQFELTPKGHTLYNLLAKKKGCCQPM